MITFGNSLNKTRRHICKDYVAIKIGCSSILQIISFWPDEWVMSYKWEMRDRRDLAIDSKTRKRNFTVDAPPRIKPNTSIAVFHGDPNPGDANDSWVKEHWQ